MKQKVVVALSGGVDSSVAAALLIEAGYEVIGATLKMRHPNPLFSARQSCGAENDLTAIREVTAKLGIPHFLLDRYDVFESHVLRPSWEMYKNGRTPNPCCQCNYLVKFGELIKFAKEQGAIALATGHYAVLENIDGNARLRRGADSTKDQSYFLYHLTGEQLNFLRFPVGEMEKHAVKKYAEKIGLKILTGKKESQDACFSSDDECFSETLRRLFNDESICGDFVYNGRRVGSHPGVHRYTIGQRKGLNIALGMPGYVKSIDASSGKIELVTDEALLESDTFDMTELNFHCPMPERCLIQIRYRTPPVPGVLTMLENGNVRVKLDRPLRAISPGQAAVFYSGELLVGGGIIQ